jgi:hypothetical protein
VPTKICILSSVCISFKINISLIKITRAPPKSQQRLLGGAPPQLGASDPVKPKLQSRINILLTVEQKEANIWNEKEALFISHFHLTFK